MTDTTSVKTTVWPAFRYRDARGAIRFLVDVLGFEERVVYGEGDTVDHAQLAWPGGGGIMLGSYREDGPFAVIPPGTGLVYLVTADPDGLYARVVAAGATIAMELRDQDYGSREFTCRDPEGVFWSFGTYAGE